MPSWIDTLDARERGEVDGFHSNNATVESREEAEHDEDEPGTASAGPEPGAEPVAVAGGSAKSTTKKASGSTKKRSR